MVIHVWDCSREEHEALYRPYVEAFKAAWREQQGAAVVPLPEGAVSELERLLDEFICQIVSVDFSGLGSESDAKKNYYQAGGRFDTIVASNLNINAILKNLKDDFLNNLQLLYHRFDTHHNLIKLHILKWQASDQRVWIEKIHFGQGDPHDKGKTTLILELNVGHKIVYKPRDLRIDAILYGNTRTIRNARLLQGQSGEPIASMIEMFIGSCAFPLKTYVVLPLKDDDGFFGFTECVNRPNIERYNEIIEKFQPELINLIRKKSSGEGYSGEQNEHFLCMVENALLGQENHSMNSSRRRNLLLCHMLEEEIPEAPFIFRDLERYRNVSRNFGAVVALSILFSMQDLHQQNVMVDADGVLSVDVEVSAQLVEGNDPHGVRRFSLSGLVDNGAGALINFDKRMELEIFNANRNGLELIPLSGDESAPVRIPGENAIFYIDKTRRVHCGPDKQALAEGMDDLLRVFRGKQQHFMGWLNDLPGDIQLRVLPYATSELRLMLIGFLGDACFKGGDGLEDYIDVLITDRIGCENKDQRRAALFYPGFSEEVLHGSLPRFYLRLDETVLRMSGADHEEPPEICRCCYPISPLEQLRRCFQAMDSLEAQEILSKIEEPAIIQPTVIAQAVGRVGEDSSGSGNASGSGLFASSVVEEGDTDKAKEDEEVPRNSHEEQREQMLGRKSLKEKKNCGQCHLL